jgi:3'-phosphoadenosine 5'-phosphosulfate sulfotransferase (PAPS reductase)/FAD synthetase
MQSLPLEAKIVKSQLRIREWYEYWNGEVYVSFSGGKDSTVLLHLVRELYPDVPAVFCDTGLEYPEIKQFVKETDNVVIIRPEMSFKTVLEKYGYPVISKKISRMIRDFQNPTDRNITTRNLYLTGLNGKGEPCPSMKMAEKWRFLIDAPFKIDDRCCDVMKKKPLRKYEKETKRKPFIATMASESGARERGYLRAGCNSFNSKNPQSIPISFWLEEDIWEYLKSRSVPYSKIYDMGEKRTGCMFCTFGVNFEDTPNRFQRMYKTHPQLHKYCINKLGLGQVLDYINIPYLPDDEGGDK